MTGALQEDIEDALDRVTLTRQCADVFIEDAALGRGPWRDEVLRRWVRLELLPLRSLLLDVGHSLERVGRSLPDDG